MEIVTLHIFTIVFYSSLIVYIAFKHIKCDSTFVLAVILTIFWFSQSVYNNFGNDSYYLNYYAVLLSLFGWMLFLQTSYLKIPNSDQVKAISVYGVNLLLILIFVFQFRIDQISQTILFDNTTIYLAAFIISIAMMYYLENIIRCLKPEYRYSHKHLLFALTMLALVNLANFYYLLTHNELNALFHYLSLLTHLALPLFLLVSINRIGKIKSSQFESKETGQIQYFMILIGSGLIVTALMQMLNLYFSQVRGDFYQAIILTFLVFGAGMLLLSNYFRTELSLYLKSYFYGDRNDYKKEWDKVSSIVRDENDIYQKIMEYYCYWSDTKSAGLYVNKQNTLRLITSTDDTFVSVLSDEIVKFDEKNHVSHNVYGLDKRSRDGNYNIFVILTIEKLLIAVCWLKSTEKPTSLNAASLQLCQTFSNEFAIRLREIDQKSELKRQQKLSVFNKTIAFLAHDLKNIVAQQQLAIENFGKFRDDPEFLEDFNETIKNSTKRLRELISQFRYDSLNSNKKSVTFDQLINLLEQKVRISGGQIHLTYNNQHNREVVLSSDVFIVVENLIKNALEATKDSKPVYVTINLGSNLQITVKDSGHGMSKEFIEQELFEPFSSTRQEHGLGIGMYHVKSALDNMNASISVDSLVDKGTTISLGIPV